MRSPVPESLRYGSRLAAAVLLAFAASALLRLPEGFWAVMSALIVVRPDTGSTLGAGWDRIRGALVGTALGLGGAALRHVGGMPDVAPLVLVTLLAFAAGLSPSLRSAPISALIVVTSDGMAGHSAGQVAWLRAVEIGVGIAAAMLVSVVDFRSRATLRFRVGAAAHLRALADALRDEPAPAAREATEATRRAALRQLSILAESADREARVFDGTQVAADPDRHRRSARLLSRITSDTALFARLRGPQAAASDVAASASIEDAAVDRLRLAAEALAAAQPGVAATLLLSPADRASTSETPVALRLLAEDLDALMRLERLAAGAPP
jgi:uncharacterized membrane protein YccC